MTPLLAVEPTSITDVHPDDIGNVWTVFTKCKENLKDGRRLENLSWRLWYREIATNHIEYPRHHLLQSLPTAQPPLCHSSASEDDEDEIPTDLESSVICSPKSHPFTSTLDHTAIAPSSHAASTSSSSTPHVQLAALLSASQASSNVPVSELREHGEETRSSDDAPAVSSTTSTRPPFNANRAQSDTVLQRRRTSRSPSTRAGSRRSRRPASFNLGKIMTRCVDVAELRRDMMLQHQQHQLTKVATEEEEDIQARMSLVSVEPPRTPPALEHLTPTLTIIQPTPRPTPPDSPKVSVHSAGRQSSLLVPNNLNKYVIMAPAPILEETFPQAIDSSSSQEDLPAAATTSMEPVPVDDPRKRKTFFFKESPGGVEHSPNSDVSSATTSTSSKGGKAKTAPTAPADPQPQPTEVVVPAAPVKPAKKGKEPARTAVVPTAKPGRFTGGGRVARPGMHARHHSTNVAGPSITRAAPVRSKSAAQLPGRGAALAPLVEAIIEEKASFPKRSASSSRLQTTSTASSSKTVTAPPPPPTKAPAKVTREPSPRARLPRATSSDRRRQVPPPARTTSSSSRRRSESSEIESSDTELDDDSSWGSDYSDGEDEQLPARAKKSEVLDPAAKALADAVNEAARQREMFAKVPTRSYSDLASQKKPGLLTTLFHPPAEVMPYLPGNHNAAGLRPHNSAQNLGMRPAPLPGTSVQTRLLTTRSTAAVPLAAQVTAAATAAAANAQPPVKKVVNPSGRPGYRLQGRPEGVDVDSSDSEEEEDLGLSKSLAQRRLEALAGMTRRKSDPSRQTQPQQAQHQQPLLRQRMTSPTVVEEPEEFVMPPSAPIGLPHPYNLPTPAPPATPRTTRRQMLASEVSESMRRQLMWERENNRRVMGGLYKRGNNTLRKPPVSVNEDFHATGW